MRGRVNFPPICLLREGFVEAQREHCRFPLAPRLVLLGRQERFPRLPETKVEFMTEKDVGVRGSPKGKGSRHGAYGTAKTTHA